jgi:hypothetical protein
MPINGTKYRVWSMVSYAAVFLIGAFVVGVGTFVYLFFVKFENALKSELVVYSSTASPSGRLAAVIYEMEGGATAPFNTQVSIAPADRPFSPRKNPSFLSLHGQHDLAVRWVGERAIEVFGIPQDIAVYRKDPRVGDITVEYRYSSLER